MAGVDVRQRVGGEAPVGAGALAEVVLDSLDVAYRASPRQLAKALEGPYRTAAWLGGDVLAVAGVAYQTSKTAGGGFATEVTPFGLRLLDLAAGTSRTVDPEATSFDYAGGLLLVRSADGPVVAYDRDGDVRFRIAVATDTWLDEAGDEGLVCAQRDLVAVVDLSTGARTKAAPGRTCPDLLAGRSSDY
jgi:hypothetical protein